MEDLKAGRTAEGEAPKPDSGREFRRHERYPVEGHAEVIVTGSSSGISLFRGRIMDISISGCYIETLARVRMRPETMVEILFAVKGSVIRAKAASRSARSKVGIGFRFVEMNAEMQERLDGLIEEAREDWLVQDAAER